MSFLSQIKNFDSGSLVNTQTRVKTCEGKTFIERLNSGEYSSTPVVGDDTGWVVDLEPDLQMAEIRPNLYFGSQDVAKSLNLLEEKGITHILNVAYGVENCFPEKFIYRTLPLLDVPETNILSIFQTTNEFLRTSIESGGKVYVHCNAGVSRCSTVVAAYLIKTENMKADEILQQMKEVRPTVCPNAGFLSQLNKYEKLLQTMIAA